MFCSKLIKSVPDPFKLNVSCLRFSSQTSDVNYAEHDKRKITRRFGNKVRHHNKGFLSRLNRRETGSKSMPFEPKTDEISQSKDLDFFGIKEFTADDVKGVVGLDPDRKKLLDERVKKVSNLQSTVASEEGFQHRTSFGKVRYDHENKVDYTGQFETDAYHILIEKRRKYILDLAYAKDSAASDDTQKVVTDYIDKQYFDISDKSQTATTNAITDEDMNYIDYQYFKDKYSTEPSLDGSLPKPIEFHFTPQWNEYQEYLNSFDRDVVKNYRRSPEQLIENIDNLTFAGDSPLRSVEEVAHELLLISKTREEDNIQDEDASTEEQIIEETDADENINDETVCPQTALDYVMKMRQGQLLPEDKAYLAHLEKKFKKVGSEFKMSTVNDKKTAQLDSKGKRNFVEQIPKLNLLRRSELVQYLTSRILFNERDLIAIDKPNGLIVEGGEENTKYPSLESLLPDLSRELFNQEGQLYIVHRLDRDATGVLLLARSLDMAKTLRDMFAQRKISKYYWAVVRGTPDPLHGIIDIPIEAGKVNGIERMSLKPDCDIDFNRKAGRTRGATPATTHYRTLRKCGNACLVEVRPEQGVKHQIRVHLGFGLQTPILGDHKYSYLDKIIPQKLTGDMLQKLGVRQSKVRNIPLHLHAKLYVVPELGINGGNISISAHLPGFFKANMSSLGLFKRESVIKNPIAF